MTNRITACFFLLFLATACNAAPPAYQEGKHYTELAFSEPVETGKAIEVREFFWYGCPHCYTLEPEIARWLKTKPKNVVFVRTPGTAANWLIHAQAFYALESIGALEQVHVPLFEALHKKSLTLNDEASLVKFVGEQGVNAEKFREAFKSFGVSLNVEKAKRLNQAYNIHSVPALVVNGKYMTSPSAAGGEKQTLEVVDFLVKRVTAEQKPKAATSNKPVPAAPAKAR